MSDQVDSSVVGGDKPASQADLSQQQAGETHAGNLPAGSALAELALKDPDAAEQLRRHYQSQKDKGVDRAVKTAEQVRDDLESFAEAMGIDLSKVSEYRRKKILDDLYEQQYGHSQSVPGGEQVEEAQSTASSTGQPVNFSEIKQAFPELDFNDGPELAALSKYGSNRTALLAELGEIKLKKSGKPTASPTEAMQPSGGKPATSHEVSSTDLSTEYNRLSSDPVANQKRMDEIEAELRKRGDL